ncbi:hypothetical protein [Cohnella faecalis]|uniref:hypothetical protein n=1 Tax=Cohnella faecalis TaxID=2315694 RepID=UPI001F1FD297
MMDKIGCIVIDVSYKAVEETGEFDFGAFWEITLLLFIRFKLSGSLPYMEGLQTAF